MKAFFTTGGDNPAGAARFGIHAFSDGKRVQKPMDAALGASLALVLASLLTLKLQEGEGALALVVCGLAFFGGLLWQAFSNRWFDRIPAILDAARGLSQAPGLRSEPARKADEAERSALIAEGCDRLTGLPDRSLFCATVERELGRLSRGLGQTFVVLLVDLDHFKTVNQTLGRKVGDRLLQSVADKLKRCTADSEMLARFGNDEFALMQFTSRPIESTTALARELIETVEGLYDLDGYQAVIGLSIGIVFAPNDGGDADTLLKNAELALVRAQSEGRGAYRFFEPEMDAEAQACHRLELDLMSALSAHEFEIHFQPVLDLATNEITGSEAVLRWRHPELGYIPPATFVPIAERIGLIGPIGEWIVREACAHAARWPKDIRVAVNVSPVQFKLHNIAALVMQALAFSGLSAARLELEITESVLLEQNPDTLSKLHQLRALGVRIALDDFGTGYSSLSYLRKFPFNKIKIDQSFVRELVSDPDCQAIIRAVVTLARSIGMRTTAEGVESLEQLDILRTEGCDEVQGYLLSPPLPAEEFTYLLVMEAKPARMRA